MLMGQLLSASRTFSTRVRYTKGLAPCRHDDPPHDDILRDIELRADPFLDLFLERTVLLALAEKIELEVHRV